jgi:uncharacterized membrane protein YtjA (UPF0391 family)
VALKPGSEDPEAGAPEDYLHDHPQESPEMWGWHGQWGRAARIAGIVVAIVLLLMITTTHYNNQGTMWLSLITALLLVSLFWDRQRRRFTWRK